MTEVEVPIVAAGLGSSTGLSTAHAVEIERSTAICQERRRTKTAR